MKGQFIFAVFLIDKCGNGIGLTRGMGVILKVDDMLPILMKASFGGTKGIVLFDYAFHIVSLHAQLAVEIDTQFDVGSKNL